MKDEQAADSPTEAKSARKESVEPLPRELQGYLRGSLGTNLLSIAHYDRDTVEYESGPESDDIDDENLADIIDDLRLQDIGKRNQEDLYDVGSLYCTVRAFDNAIVLHFPEGDERGTLVATKPESAPELTEIIKDVLNLLDDYSEQDVSRVHNWG